jgi:hypothetical protein
MPELYPPDFRVRPFARAMTSRFREITTRRTVTMPDRVSPHVKLVFAEMGVNSLDIKISKTSVA